MTLPPWTVRDLCASVPLSDREWIILVRAYLDASGQQADPVVVVAGFLGFPAHFERFEKQWNSFLSEFELDHFHAAEFWARQSRPYCNWSDAQHLKAQGDVCRILSDAAGPPCGIGVALNVWAFNKWREALDHYYPSDPSIFA